MRMRLSDGKSICCYAMSYAIQLLITNRPELNRHGDSDAHHALPARETGQHGFETNPLERSLSSSSELQYADYPVASHPDYDLPQHSPMPMALNGSSFGASSSLEDDYALSEKYPPPSPHPPSHDEHDNYTSLPLPCNLKLQLDSVWVERYLDMPRHLRRRTLMVAFR